MILSDIFTLPNLLMTLLLFMGVLLIIVILLQKGRGGGLAGAFGGSGGQSALGTKAGDVFTKITVVMAVIWVILAGVSGIATRADLGKFPGATVETPEDPGVSSPPGSKKADEDDKGETANSTENAPSPTAPNADSSKSEKKKPAATKDEKKAETSKPTDTTEAKEKKQESPAKPASSKPKSE